MASGAGDGGLIHRAAGENVVVADLGIEQRENLIELARGGRLRRRLPVVVERERALLIQRLLDRAAGAAELVSTDWAMLSVVPTVVAVLL